MDTLAEESCRRETLVLDNHFTVPNMDVVRTHGFAARRPYKGAPASPCNSRDLYEFFNRRFGSLHSRLPFETRRVSSNRKCLRFPGRVDRLPGISGNGDFPLPAKMNQVSFQHLDGETASR